MFFIWIFVFANKTISSNPHENKEIIKKEMIEHMAEKENQFDVVISYKGDIEPVKKIIEDILIEIEKEEPYQYFSTKHFSTTIKKGFWSTKLTFIIEYQISKKEEEMTKEKIKEIISVIINNDMSEMEKERAIHDFIVLNTSYDTKLEKKNVYEALFEHQAVCQGYALLTYLFLNEVGIENKIVTGKARSKYREEDHVWNLVKINNQWYHVDTTWDDPIPDVKGQVLYDYFNLTDDELARNHSWDKTEYPSAQKSFKSEKERWENYF